ARACRRAAGERPGLAHRGGRLRGDVHDLRRRLLLRRLPAAGQRGPGVRARRHRRGLLADHPGVLRARRAVRPGRRPLRPAPGRPRRRRRARARAAAHVPGHRALAGVRRPRAGRRAQRGLLLRPAGGRRGGLVPAPAHRGGRDRGLRHRAGHARRGRRRRGAHRGGRLARGLPRAGRGRGRRAAGVRGARPARARRRRRGSRAPAAEAPDADLRHALLRGPAAVGGAVRAVRAPARVRGEPWRRGGRGGDAGRGDRRGQRGRPARARRRRGPGRGAADLPGLLPADGGELRAVAGGAVVRAPRRLRHPARRRLRRLRGARAAAGRGGVRGAGPGCAARGALHLGGARVGCRAAAGRAAHRGRRRLRHHRRLLAGDRRARGRARRPAAAARGVRATREL
ncbi:MAG: hypothetical protein AVDCRST_MAG54-4482, partial [uncultured Actinomycetospora sp.]